MWAGDPIAVKAALPYAQYHAGLYLGACIRCAYIYVFDMCTHMYMHILVCALVWVGACGSVCLYDWKWSVCVGYVCPACSRVRACIYIALLPVCVFMCEYGAVVRACACAHSVVCSRVDVRLLF